MATKQEVQRAAVKLYGKGAFLEWGHKPSSQQYRDSIRSKLLELRTACDEAKQLAKEAGDHTEELVAAARFVLDTEADRTAIEALRKATELVESERQLRQSADDAYAAWKARRDMGGSYYYRYKVLVAKNGPIRYAEQKHEADSLDELMEMMNSKKKLSTKGLESMLTI